jgi:hypothetical protein
LTSFIICDIGTGMTLKSLITQDIWQEVVDKMPNFVEIVYGDNKRELLEFITLLPEDHFIPPAKWEWRKAEEGTCGFVTRDGVVLNHVIQVRAVGPSRILSWEPAYDFEKERREQEEREKNPQRDLEVTESRKPTPRRSKMFPPSTFWLEVRDKSPEPVDFAVFSSLPECSTYYNNLRRRYLDTLPAGKWGYISARFNDEIYLKFSFIEAADEPSLVSIRGQGRPKLT